MTEFDFIDWMRRRNAFGERVLIGIGDDAAVLDLRGETILAVTTDTLVQDIDFILSPETLFGIGWKTLCVSLSDIAAMGLVPMAATCTMSVPPELDRAGMEEIYRGMKAASDRFACPVVGGDLSAAKPGGLSLTSTVFGGASGRGLKPVTRAGAQPGDVIAVTGALGGSILGKHLEFFPRLEAAESLNANYHVHAMIDISDGLSGDLLHLCEASGVGAVIDADAVPVSEAARALTAQSGRDPLAHALHDGEDFELLFTLAAADWKRLSAAGLACGVVALGEITADPGLRLRDASGIHPLTVDSYRHDIG